MYIVGMSENGKTYWTNELVRDALKKKFKILYVVNKAFDVEPEIQKLFENNKNVFIISAGDLEKPTIDVIEKTLVSKSRKIIIVDNFTYSISLAFLNLVTFVRKYNASIIFISHTFFASRSVSPRLREVLRYLILFYMPPKARNDNLKMILDEDLLEKYRKEVTYLSYKFMAVDTASSFFVISKLPEFKINIVFDKSKKEEDKKIKFN
jgi:hypothetical protein